MVEKEVVERWEKLGFLDGFENDKELLANNYENMALYNIHNSTETWEKEYENGVFETIIFAIIRRINAEVEMELDPKMLRKYVFKTKYEDIKPLLSDNADRKEIEKLLRGDELWSVFARCNFRSNIDTEAYVCAALSEYIIKLLKEK